MARQVFDHWSQQSPIKLFHSESIFSPFPRGFLSIDYKGGPFAGEFEGEDGHQNFVLKKPPGNRTPTIKLGSMIAELIKIHLHTPSEHDLEGKNKAGEIHLIHKIKQPTNGSELLVVGVFFDKDDKADNMDFFNLWANQLKSAKKGVKSGSSSFDINAEHLLPNTKKWYRYEGSLTSEPYSEIVSWLVFCDSLGITSSSLRLLKQYAHQPERPTQDLNRRYVLRNFR